MLLMATPYLLSTTVILFALLSNISSFSIEGTGVHSLPAPAGRDRFEESNFPAARDDLVEDPENRVKSKEYFNQKAAENLTEKEIGLLTSALIQILEDPWNEYQPPILYIENNRLEQEQPNSQFVDFVRANPETDDFEPDISNVEDNAGKHLPAKRARYYRKYPWKRQNSRARIYDAENKYMCQPSREDVYRLLLALHDSRQGNRTRTVNFCNRRRSASAIYTNIRFLGRK